MESNVYRAKIFNCLLVVYLAFILILSGCSSNRNYNVNVRRPKPNLVDTPSSLELEIVEGSDVVVSIPSSLEIVDGSLRIDGDTINCELYNPSDTAITIIPDSICRGYNQVISFFDEYGNRNKSVSFYLYGEESYSQISFEPYDSHDISFSVKDMNEQAFRDEGLKLLVNESTFETGASMSVTAIKVIDRVIE